MNGHSMNDHVSSSAGFVWLHHPRQLRVRRGIVFGHMVCGITVGVILLTLGLSGSLLVFKDQLEPRLRPQLLQTSPVSPLINTDELLSSAMARAKDLRPLLIDVGTQPAAAIYLSHGSWFPSSSVQVVYVDRGTGRVRDSVLYSDGLVNKLIHLHTELFLGERGSQMLGCVAIVVLLMTLSGYLLWWPGKSGWKRAIRIDWKARWPRLN